MIVKPEPEGPCWLWPKRLKDGYAVFGYEPRRRVHRELYELYRGPIPEGLELDHLCEQKSCVNPWHMEAVTHKVNMARGKMAQRTHCKNGHPFSGDNVVYLHNHRRCRACQKVRVERWREKHGKRNSARKRA